MNTDVIVGIYGQRLLILGINGLYIYNINREKFFLCLISKVLSHEDNMGPEVEILFSSWIINLRNIYIAVNSSLQKSPLLYVL
jgi:hypothetical protein